MAEVKEPKIEIERGEDNFLIINGKKYFVETTKTKKIDGVEHEDKVIYKEVNEKEYKSLIGALVKELSKKTTKEELLIHLIKGYDMKSLRAFVKRIKEKKPIRKQRGCLSFKIGEKYMQLID